MKNKLLLFFVLGFVLISTIFFHYEKKKLVVGFDSASSYEKVEILNNTSSKKDKMEREVFDKVPESLSYNKYDDLFKPHKFKSKFVGKGNKFASYTEKTKKLYHNYFEVLEIHDAFTIQRVFLHNHSGLYLIYESEVFREPKKFNKTYLKKLSLSPINSFLTYPLSNSINDENYKVERNVPVPTEAFTIDDSIKISFMQNNRTLEYYFVEGLGLVMYREKSAEGKIISSTLSKKSFLELKKDR